MEENRQPAQSPSRRKALRGFKRRSRSYGNHRGSWRISENHSPSQPKPTTISASMMTNPTIWRSLPELSILIDRLPPDAKTEHIWQWFSEEGEISSIDMFESKRSPGLMSAKVTFEPVPSKAFWECGTMNKTHPEITSSPDGVAIELSLVDEAPQAKWTSQIPSGRTYPFKLNLSVAALQFGALLSPDSMIIRANLDEFPSSLPSSLLIEAKPKRLTVYFPIVTNFGLPSGVQAKAQMFKFGIEFTQVKKIFKVMKDNIIDSIILPLEIPPHYFWKNENVSQSFLEDSLRWSSQKSWFRVTNIVKDLRSVMALPIAAHHDIHDSSFIDIGRWTTIRLIFDKESVADESMSHVLMALEDNNVKIETYNEFEFQEKSTTMWNYLDQTDVQHVDSSVRLLSMTELPFVPLDFSVRYQLEVCVTRGVLNEHSVSLEFLQKLAEFKPEDAARLLEYLVDRNEKLYDPMALFTSREAAWYSPHTSIPHYCSLVRKAIITPTSIRFNSPTVETSNRVMRQYKHIQDRFLRIQFVEESEAGHIKTNNQQNDEIWKRLLRALHKGIQVGDRKFEFLAFGSSQLRQSGVYFFAPTKHISCDDIRRWMGDFTHIRIVAKYAARLGQCFSTTREMSHVLLPDIKYIPDIEKNGYCFTDGVGIISEFLGRMIVDEMTGDVFLRPSAFQFRMGGCKGVLVIWPNAKRDEVHIRASQEKFKSEVKRIEIIRCAGYSTATLNRQTITILESLGVGVKAFEVLLDQQIHLYEQSMANNSIAIDTLTTFVDENQSTLVIAELLKAGFRSSQCQEPFVLNLLQLWRSWSLKQLKDKARITVPKSAFVLGCVDETGTLRGHHNDTEGSKEKDVSKLPQIFLQLSDLKRVNKSFILEGVCIVGRNPSLHPGDIRVVEAVNNPALHHLKDVVVFSSTGDRPVPNMLSGGDLDGDDFFVIWDKSLLPPEWNHPAMNYMGPKPKELQRDVNVDDLRNFFVKYLKNDVLGLIATSHLAFADKEGPKSAICLKLAELHSKAVDYPKTGEPAEWNPKQHQPYKWPHFMEKRNSYHSRKSLGVIYDKVVKQAIDFLPDWDRAFDQRILTRFELENNMLKQARQIKAQYDTSVRRILYQHAVETEFELYTGWAMSRPPIGSDYKRQEDLGREFDALKQRFRDMCYEAAGGYHEPIIDKFVAAMYKITEEEIKIALFEHHRGPTNEGGNIIPARRLLPKSMPLISFPWIFPWVMARIATSKKQTSLLAAATHRVNPIVAPTKPHLPTFEPKSDTNEARKEPLQEPTRCAPAPTSEHTKEEPKTDEIQVNSREEENVDRRNEPNTSFSVDCSLSAQWKALQDQVAQMQALAGNSTVAGSNITDGYTNSSGHDLQQDPKESLNPTFKKENSHEQYRAGANANEDTETESDEDRGEETDDDEDGARSE